MKKRMMLWVLLLASAALVCGVAFALPVTKIAHADVRVALKDRDGKPIAGSKVLIWEYDHYSRHAQTDAQGVATFPRQSFSYGKLLFQFWKNRPAEFPIRLRMPDLSPLYYRFEVKTGGAPRYHVFNADYDYFFGEKWVGEFDERGQTRNTIVDMQKEYATVPPDAPCQCVPLWQAGAKIEQKPDGSEAFVITLDLRRNGEWLP